MKRRVAVLAALAATMLTAACTSSGSPAGQRFSVGFDRLVIPGPAGVVAGTPPTLAGDLWILAGTGGVRTLHELDQVDEKLGPAIPVNSGAASLAQSSSTILALGVATFDTGAVEFLDGTDAKPVSTVAVGAPVRAVTAGADGSTFYALNGMGASMSVSLIDSISSRIIRTVPVPLDTVSIATDPDQQRIFALEADGQMTIVAASGGQVLSRFFVGAAPRVVAVSGDGSTMYVLKGGTSGVDNVGIFDLALEKQTHAIAAPAHTVDIEVSSDDATLYAFVGTPTFGNVQLLATGR